MTGAPTPAEIFERAVDEGQRRLDQSILELASTSFIAGFTIVFGIVALGIVEAKVAPLTSDLSGLAKIAGALAFGIGMSFLIVGRTELFNENFADPVAAAVDRSGTWLLPSLFRLWVVTLVFNIIGGGLLAIVFSIEGALPPETPAALVAFAEDIGRRGTLALLASAIAGGTLVSLLSFLLVAVNSVGTRLVLGYLTGFLLALGPFDHVVVTVLHVFFGILYGANIGYGTLLVMMSIVTVGNVIGGLGLVTFTHIAQGVGARESES